MAENLLLFNNDTEGSEIPEFFAEEGMRLESALYTSKQGIEVNGQAVAVVGDNISNANTTAFKAARPEFSDLLGEISSAKNSEVISGVGDGVSLSSVRTLHELGVIEPTGRELDIGVGGQGYMMVGDPSAPYYSRNGALEISQDGLLLGASGKPIVGYQGTGTELSNINMYQVTTAGTPTSTMALYGNFDASAAVTAIPANPTTYKQIAAAASYTSSQSVYDSLGQRHDVFMAFYKTAANTWVVQGYMDGGDLTGGTEGVPVQVGANATLNFTGSGIIEEANRAAANLTIAANYSNGATAGAFPINFGAFTQYAGGSLINQVVQDGLSNGNVSSYEFDSDGKIYALLDNGNRATIGSIPLATFPNLDGLERVGTSLFARNDKAGEPVVGNPGQGSFGTVEGKSLERSTVDIASQFINLVLYQRGYQANSQVLTTAGQMVRDTIALIR